MKKNVFDEQVKNYKKILNLAYQHFDLMNDYFNLATSTDDREMQNYWGEQMRIHGDLGTDYANKALAIRPEGLRL